MVHGPWEMDGKNLIFMEIGVECDDDWEFKKWVMYLILTPCKKKKKQLLMILSRLAAAVDVYACVWKILGLWAKRDSLLQWKTI